MNELQHRLHMRQKKKLLRERWVVDRNDGVILYYNNRQFVNFCSNDYLNVSHHPKVIHALQSSADRYGVGSHASPMICGFKPPHIDFEHAMAEFLNRDAAVLFSSGYLANLSVITAMVTRFGMVIADKQIHASLIDAARLSSAKLKRYSHLNNTHLNQLLEKYASHRNKVVVTEGVFSMDGEMADLIKMSDLSRKFQALLIVDDAHGIGVVGKNGGGTTEYYQLSQESVPLLICPLGKAFGVMGAIVAGKKDLIEGIIQLARTYTYSTAMPPALASAAMASLKVIKKASKLRESLNQLIQYFIEMAENACLPIITSHSPIQSLLVRECDCALWLSDYLLDKGFFVRAIRPPTVPENSARLRITLNVLHTKQHIHDLVILMRDGYAQYCRKKT